MAYLRIKNAEGHGSERVSVRVELRLNRRSRPRRAGADPGATIASTVAQRTDCTIEIDQHDQTP